MMKNLLIALSLLFAVSTLASLPTADVSAQNMSKKERKRLKKKWKKIAKGYKKNPLALKAKEEAYQKQIEALKQKNNELTERYTELQAELDAAMAANRDCDRRIDSARAEFERVQTAYEMQKKRQETKSVESGTPGLVFRVQVGAYEKFDMSQYSGQTGKNFTGESMGALNKYMMGKFRSYDIAKAFRNDIRKLGIRDAWVVAYNDGVRIEIKRALELSGGGSTTPDNSGGFDDGSSEADTEGGSDTEKGGDDGYGY